MDWARAIKRNQSALSRIVLALIAMVGLTAETALTRLPGPLYRQALRILRPAEAAVRRLIVIAARGLVVKPMATRPMPKGLKIKAKGSAGAMAFRLCDPRTRIALWYPKRRKPLPDHLAPRCLTIFKDPNLSPVFQPETSQWRAAPPKDDSVDAARLNRRLMAIKRALDDIPAQAKRLARWRMRQQAKAKSASPLRPGRPPGHRKKETHKVDAVLKECHALARDVEPDETS
jgi:hypothetical protein